MYKVDFRNGKAVEWIRGREGSFSREKEYQPAFYVEPDDLFKVRARAAELDQVRSTKVEKKYTSLKDHQKSKVLRIETAPGNLKAAVHTLKKSFPRFELRFYETDFEPQHRYCLQEGKNPVPKFELEKMSISLDRKSIGNKDISELKIDGNGYSSERNALEELEAELEYRDPEVLIFNRSGLLPVLQERIELGRSGKVEKLAGENTVNSYGKTVHSSARYSIDGRIIIDRSNSFLLDEAGMHGMWDLVRRSKKPLQELSWASIGNVLTSIEIVEARQKDILTPWRNWEGETPKEASVMHAADRGGFIFSPEPGIVEEVHRCDFSSMFPNIMIEENISPETTRCECCDNSHVPELGFSRCEDITGFIPRVLWKLVADRQRWKHESKEASGSELKRLEQKIDAVKWLLVSCYGYMGHAHASYGAIKCHQAINAHARELLREAKEEFESGGWKVEHGIIDSIWISKHDKTGSEVAEVCQKVTSKTGIELEHEEKFDWCAFVPRKSDSADIGTLNRYFGFSNGELITAGIEMEQSSTPEFVKKAQRSMIGILDQNMSFKPVVEDLKRWIGKIDREELAPEELVIKKKVSKSLENYKVENRSTAAIRRARINGFDVKPGQQVRYVVRDDSAASANRVRLDFESEKYDRDFYRDQLIRAAETVVSPLGMERKRIEKELKGFNRQKLSAY